MEHYSLIEEISREFYRTFHQEFLTQLNGLKKCQFCGNIERYVNFPGNIQTVLPIFDQ